MRVPPRLRTLCIQDSPGQWKLARPCASSSRKAYRDRHLVEHGPRTLRVPAGVNAAASATALQWTPARTECAWARSLNSSSKLTLAV